MALQKLKKELQETIRQSREMSEAISSALTLLNDPNFDRQDSLAQINERIIVGLQAQDRLEQRCANIERAINHIDMCPTCENQNSDAFWNVLSLDELANPDWDKEKVMAQSGEVDLF